ncbi:hypothetical protein [Prauserella cavernicola]|uniref:Uncharacterized protein n=1 Tax=Prauserella cavernicola TaxID=2800127 RepID=A0A934QX01_9PSEU|nr:hypothetical protein [Prauserella cavernicola]MBK1787996.1 hypothetical protein [Prauserella cavernicola]
MATKEYEIEDVLGTLLEAEAAESIADLEIDPVQMPVAKSSVTYTVAVHC